MINFLWIATEALRNRHTGQLLNMQFSNNLLTFDNIEIYEEVRALLKG